MTTARNMPVRVALYIFKAVKSNWIKSKLVWFLKYVFCIFVTIGCCNSIVSMQIEASSRLIHSIWIRKFDAFLINLRI
jgi:hypothetical protein